MISDIHKKRGKKMKEREFDLENYRELLLQKAYLLIADKMALKIGEISFKPTKPSRYNIECSIDFNSLKPNDLLALFSGEESKKITDELKEEFENKKSKTIEQFTKTKSIVDTILFDDKDYQELCIALDSIYYCQAETMLRDVLESKLKGKTAKAMKYQARKMALLNNVTCD